jgi:hypothetical protein
MNETYNGWKNRATWNVALWVQNDESLYNMAIRYLEHCKKQNIRVRWGGFVVWAHLAGTKTPDGYGYHTEYLDTRRLTEMLKELAE